MLIYNILHNIVIVQVAHPNNTLMKARIKPDTLVLILSEPLTVLMCTGNDYLSFFSFAAIYTTNVIYHIDKHLEFPSVSRNGHDRIHAWKQSYQRMETSVSMYGNGRVNATTQTFRIKQPTVSYIGNDCNIITL